MPESNIIRIEMPINRVEGDLEIRVDIEDGNVVDAWSTGNMYRGFENILLGRGALDGLVITPRICGICSTAHLTAASKALDMIAGIKTPPNAVRIRNIALMVEKIQSDMRHAFLMFMPDFTNPVYKDSAFFEEAVHRYLPFQGEAAIETIRETKKVLGIVAIIGGQWPHSSYMVPGGIVSVPSPADMTQCLFLLKQFRDWYEKSVLGCPVERLQEIASASDLTVWLEENDAHRNSQLGFFIRMSRDTGLDRIGKGHDNFISFGAFDIPDDSEVQGRWAQNTYFPAGFAKNTKILAFDQARITEHMGYSWFVDDIKQRHPSNSKTQPYASGREGEKYSWAKAPRYDGLPAETGPLAEMIISKHPFFVDYLKKNGSNVFIRQLARLIRPALLMPVIEQWIRETTEGGSFYEPFGEITDGEGFGLTDVTRGALGHWVRIKDGLIDHYQIITPTAWNGSPRDDAGIRGPWEQALVGTPVKDVSNPVELGHVVRSFDACLVCAVHAIDKRDKSHSFPVCLNI
jgi:hydrogenase large subunit